MAAQPQANILVVDDEPANLARMQELLAAPDQEVVVARSGKEALRHLLKADFALILLDIDMPEIDGFEAASLIRKRRRSLHTPIIFMTTAFEETRLISSSYEIGVVDYIFKPVDPRVLLAKVAAFVDLYKRNADLYAQILQRKNAERELFKAKEELESRIRERTANLVVTNKLLQTEIAMRERAEQNLRKSEMEARKLSLVASSTENAVIITDAEKRIEWVNDSFVRIYGFSLQECKGQFVRALVGDSEVVPTDPASRDSELPAGNADHRIEVRRIDRAGRKRWLTVECRRITDDDGTVTGFIEIESDITERKQAEADLHKAKRAAEAANLAKSTFLANMSHEIRTPMNAIIGMTDLTLQTALTAEQREYLNLLKASSETLLTVINDILDYSKIESGHFDIESVPFSLRESLGDTIKTLALDAHRKNIELVCEIDPDLPDALLGDPIRLRQVVINLVGNAIKFTEHGHVLVRVEQQGGEGRQAVFKFTVADSGIGIPREKLATIFEPFLQADTSISRLFGGSGLGLTISARLVEMMNGRIWLESEIGKGSSFHFTLRFGLQSVGPVPSEGSELNGLRAVVVEDHPVGRRFLVNTLRHWGMVVDEASSAGTAMDVIERGVSAPEPYRLVLLDADLPDIDGYALATKIRNSPGFAPGCVVMLASTLRGEPGAPHRDVTFRSLTKPVKVSELLRVARLVTCRTARIEAHADVACAGGGRIRPKFDLLLVEDNPTNRRLAQIILEKEGHRVVSADHGAAALEMLARMHFDLVLMDVQMPNMDGIETTIAIRKMEELTGGHIPVLALTAHAMSHDRERCIKAGMDGYLTKPVKPESLIEAIERLNMTLAHRPERGPVLDRGEFLALINGDMKLLGEVTEIFMSDCGDLMQRVRRAINNADHDEFGRALHTLRGMFRSIAAHAAQEVTGDLQALTLDANRAQAEAVFRQLEREVEALKAVLVGIYEERTGTISPPGEIASARVIRSGHERLPEGRGGIGLMENFAS